jgi:hypothetical protein
MFIVQDMMLIMEGLPSAFLDGPNVLQFRNIQWFSRSKRGILSDKTTDPDSEMITTDIAVIVYSLPSRHIVFRVAGHPVSNGALVPSAYVANLYWNPHICYDGIGMWRMPQTVDA